MTTMHLILKCHSLNPGFKCQTIQVYIVSDIEVTDTRYIA